MHIFLSAGEPSGDQHAAQLMQQLQARRPGIRLSGLGGSEMKSAGLEMHYQLTDLAVMGFVGVAPLLKTFRRLYLQAGEFFERERPDAVVLVDFPGFNWWIAKAAKRANVPVYYYCPPQLWAWAGWRIRKVRRWVDCILSVLPFEAEWYRERGVDVEYVGHPFFDEVASHPLDERLVESLKSPGQKTVGVLPGSRKQEVNRNFPMMLEIIAELHRKHPQVRFPVACYKQWHHDRCRELWEAYNRTLPLELHVGRTSEVIQAADCCLMVSGSVSLELLARQTPAVVMYRAGFLTYWLARILGTSDYITLTNVIADRPVMPEFPCLRDHGRHLTEMKRILDDWLSRPEVLANVTADVASIASGVVAAGGVARAAEVLLSRLDQASARQKNSAVPARRAA